MTQRDVAAAHDPFEALLASRGGIVLLTVDPRLRITRAGPDAALLAERPVEQLSGLSLIAAFGSASLDAVARHASASDARADGEADLGRLGARQFAVEAVPFGPPPDEGEPGRALVLALHEITALRRVERVRRDFVANISHELRTPLASVKLLAETLSSGAADDPSTAVDFARQIEREIDHLAQLVDELLDLSMIESGETALARIPVAPAELLAAVARRIGPLAERQGVRVRQLAPEDVDPADPRVEADPDRLGQALLNLAHNAVKYSRPGGEVRLGWEPRPSAVRFTVADDGIGIPVTHRARIFERFYKVNRSRSRDDDDPPRHEWGGGSSGLGLAIVRHIAEAHGGAVGVESEEGVGSTFWIELPALSPDA